MGRPTRAARAPSLPPRTPMPCATMPAPRPCDVTVVGAGVVGVATAWAAARRGLSVELVDRAEGPALGASYANGAQLSYA
ncbi:MAG: FAD-dependent oxidoreductase, partial [Luteimonas sp.]